MKKNIAFLLLTCLTLLSCDSDDDSISTRFPESFPVTYQFRGYESKLESKTSPITLPYREQYVFESNSRVTKTRVQDDGAQTSISGAFIVSEIGSTQLITVELENSSITTGCTGTNGTTEQLNVINSSVIINRTDPCDGPNYRYDLLLQ